MFARALGAQSILVGAGSSASTQIAASSTLAVPLTVDVSAAAGVNLEVLTSVLTWAPTKLKFDSVKVGSFGTLSANIGNTGAGSLSIVLPSTVGITSPITMGTVYFTALSTDGGTRVQVTPVAAVDQANVSVLPAIRSRGINVCVGSVDLWGDASGDGVVNVIDAQQIARYSIGLAVGNTAAAMSRGDVNADGYVNVIDAQQIARHSIGLSASARVNTLMAAAATVTSVSLTPAVVSLTGGSMTPLTGVARDGSNIDLSGCAPITWASSDTSHAIVNSDGQVTGIAAGTAIITATAGGQSARSTVTVVDGAGLSIYAGDNQVQAQGLAFIAPIAVLAKNSSGKPISGLKVTFSVTSGDGHLASSSAGVTTDASGRAWTTWSPGNPTLAQTVTATAAGMTPVAFTGRTLVYTDGDTRCELVSAGAAYCWGENTNGQVGDGSTQLRNVPTRVAGNLTFSSLAEGSAAHACGLTSDGKAYCWGSNNFGQLGDGTTVARSSPVPVLGTYTFVRLAVSATSTCGVTPSGALVCWGGSGYGLYGDGLQGSFRATPTAVVAPGLSFTSITLGRTHACGIATGGTIYCWGSGTLGALGNGSYVNGTTPVAVSGSRLYSSVSAGEYHTCAVTTEGAAYCWGHNEWGQLGTNSLTSSPIPLALTGNLIWTSISATLKSTCGLASGGAAYCWGNNLNGELGDGTTVQRQVPAAVSSNIVFTAVRAYPRAACGRALSGQPYCWGNGFNGQVGNGSQPSVRSIPAPVIWVEGSPNVALSLVAKNGQSASDGGLLEAPQGTAVEIPPSVLVRNFAGNPVAGASVTFAVVSGGGAVTNATAMSDADGIAAVGSWILGPALGPNTLSASVAGLPPVTFFATAVLGASSIAKLEGDEQVQFASSRFPALIAVRVKDAANNPMAGVSVQFTVTAGFGSVVGNSTVRTDATGRAAVGWSAGNRAGVQVISATVAGLPAATFTARAVELAAASTQCELARGGAAYCWGKNGNGQVGDGSTTNRYAPTAVNGGIAFAALSEGSADHVCGLTSAGQAYCWGANGFGQLGDGTISDQPGPVLVKGGFTFTQLAVSTSATCGRMVSGSLMCWGGSGYGLFADGVLGVTHLTPVAVTAPGLSFAMVSLGDNHTCAITTAGAMYCWGQGTYGQLGSGAYANQTVPTLVSGGYAFSRVSAGGSSTCGIATDAVGLCWGNNSNGQLGNGSTSYFTVPTPVVGGLSFSRLNTSIGSYTCGLVLTGQAYCWGLNYIGQLGDGTITQRLSPTAVQGGTQFSEIRVRTNATCALSASGMLFCFGGNSYGQVGDGTTNDRLTPTSIPWMSGTLAVTAGNNQVAAINSKVATAPSVRITDIFGPKAGVPVIFAVTGGNGALTNASQTTNADGVATVGSWTLGSIAGVNTLAATAAGVTGSPIVFTATATASTPNLLVDRVYLTQSVQTYTGTVPLVAGRSAFLRVFVRSDLPNSHTPAVRVRYYRNGTLLDTQTISASSSSVVTVVNEGVLTSSWNILVSAALMQPGLSVLADVDPGQLIAESNETDNVYPASGVPMPLDIRTTTVFNTMMIPVLQTPNGLQGNVTEANKNSFLALASRIYPIAEFSAVMHAPYSYNGVIVRSDQSTWNKLLSEILALRTAEGGTRNYYGVLKSAGGSGIAGSGYIGAAAAIGLDEDDGYIAAHEWGHNFGRQHADCGGATGTDANYPYASASIGVYGYDVANNVQFAPSDTKDLMSYCYPRWISDYTYKAVLEYRASLAAASSVAATATKTGLLVWGRIGANGAVVLEPSFEVDAPASLPSRPGHYRLQGTDESGRPMFDLSFDGEVVDHGSGARAFAFVLPVPAAGVNVATIRILDNDRPVAQRAMRPLPVAEVTSPLTLRATRVSGTRSRLEWDAAKYPVALVRDAATGQILSFARGGRAEMVTAPNGQLDVSLSDGVRTTRRRVSITPQ